MVHTKEKFIGKDEKTYIIRSPEPSDGEQLIRHLKTTAQETEYGLSYPEEMTFSIQDEERFINSFSTDDRSIMLCVFDGKMMVGYAFLSNVLEQKKARHRASFGVTILKQFWRQGLGQKLVTELLAFARDAGYEQIELEVASSNVSAIHLYEKLGFVAYGRRSNSLKLKSGAYFDELLMALGLN